MFIKLATSYFQQFPNYCRMVTQAKLKAKRSVLIDHCGFENINLRKEFQNIEQIYTIEKETRRGISRLTLIEFKTEKDAEIVSKKARHNEGLLPVPLKIFRYLGSPDQNDNKPIEDQELDVPHETVRLTSETSLSTKISSYKELLNNNMMSLVALKMRFITLVNLERILCSGLFEEFELLPFGSSVIDLGCDNGDLDLVVVRKGEEESFLNQTGTANRLSTKLVHIDKSLYNENRDRCGVRGTMRYFDNILREYMPLTDGHGVLFIRHARVPVIKFTARITSIDCDLSFDLGLDQKEHDSMNTKSSGTCMAELLYSLCRNNNLFPAIGVYLKLFGKSSLITTKELNVGVTNFQYLTLIMSYLQQISITSQENGEFKIVTRAKFNTKSSKNSSKSRPELTDTTPFVPIVPPFKDMFSDNRLEIEKNPKFYTDEQIEKILPMIIVDFFQFYSNFDFMKNSLNLYDGKIEKKLDNSTIYVQNPIDKSQNVCHNVNRKGLDYFVKQCRSAIVGMKHGIHYDCPLTLIKFLLLKEQQNSRTPKMRPGQDGVYLNSVANQNRGLSALFSNEDIAQDVCR